MSLFGNQMPFFVRPLVVAVAVFCVAAAADAKTLRWSMATDAATIDPHLAEDDAALALVRHLYEGLTRFDEERRPVPHLARGWSVSDSGLRWRFFLPTGVRFHDGRRLRADDVVYSLIRAKRLLSPSVSDLSHIRLVRKANDLVVEITTDRPDALLPARLAGVMIVSRNWVIEHELAARRVVQDYDAQDFDSALPVQWFASREANGTGPYKLANRELDKTTSLVANPDYWDKTPGAKPELRELEFFPIFDDLARIGALDEGKLDLVLDPSGSNSDLKEAFPYARVTDTDRALSLLLGFNVSELAETDGAVNPFADERVRRAIAKTVDSEAMRKVIFSGSSYPTGMPVAPTVVGWAPELDNRLPVDLEGAKALMAEAGFADGFSTTLSCPTDGYLGNEVICRAIVGMLAQISIDVTVSQRTLADHMAALKEGQAAFYLLPWETTTFDSRQALESLFHTADGSYGGLNFSSYGDDALDSMIEDLSAVFDPDEAQSLSADAWEVALQAMVYVPLHHQINTWVTRPAFEVGPDTLGLPDFAQTEFATPVVFDDQLPVPPTGP